MQHRLTGFQFVHNAHARHINDLHRVIQGVGEVHPDLSTIRAGNGEHRLTMNGDTSNFSPCPGVNNQDFMAMEALLGKQQKHIHM